MLNAKGIIEGNNSSADERNESITQALEMPATLLQKPITITLNLAIRKLSKGTHMIKIIISTKHQQYRIILGVIVFTAIYLLIYYLNAQLIKNSNQNDLFNESALQELLKKRYCIHSKDPVVYASTLIES